MANGSAANDSEEPEIICQDTFLAGKAVPAHLFHFDFVLLTACNRYAIYTGQSAHTLSTASRAKRR